MGPNGDKRKGREGEGRERKNGRKGERGRKGENLEMSTVGRGIWQEN